MQQKWENEIEGKLSKLLSFLWIGFAWIVTGRKTEKVNVVGFFLEADKIYTF